MNSKNKKIIVLLLVLMLLLTGCNSKEEKDKKKQADDLDGYAGTWVSTPENQYSVQINETETVGGTENYYLKLDGKGNYKLDLFNDYSEEGTYTVDKEKKQIILKYNGHEAEHCDILNKNELQCDRYAIKYVKEEE